MCIRDRLGRVYAKDNVRDTGNELLFPKTEFATTKFVSSLSKLRIWPINLPDINEIPVVKPKKIGITAISRILAMDSDLANLLKIRHGVKRSTFSNEMIF